MTSKTSWKVLVWSAGAVGLAAVASGSSACTVTVNGGDDAGEITQPEPDASEGAEASVGEEAASGQDAAVGQDASEEAGDDASTAETGGSCSTGIDTGMPACNDCIESSCCTQLDTCGAPDSSGVDDAGSSFCISYLQCVLDIAASAGGSISEGQTSCSPSYNSTQTSNGNALLSCITSSCASSCQ